MKYFFGINQTIDKNNTEIDGSIFINKTVSPEMQEELEELNNDNLSLINKTNYLKFFKMVIILSIVLMINKAVTTLCDIYSSEQLFAFIALLIDVACFLTVMLSGIRLRKRIKEAISSSEYNQTEQKIEQLITKASVALGVPDNAVKMDVFSFIYKSKNNGFKFIKSDVDCSNNEVKAFINDGSLCFFDIDKIFAINIDSITQIKKVKRKITSENWNKTIEPNAAQYRDYKIKVKKYNEIITNFYYSISINKDGETYQLFIPPYEIDAFLSLTGLSVSDEEMCITE